MDIIYGFFGLLAGWIFKDLFGTYFKKKGENLATKEDIREITDRIESVKHDYVMLQKRHGFRYEKEYEILSLLATSLIELRDSVLSLRPVVEFVDPSRSDEERKTERLTRLFVAGKNLYLVSETNRPFFPSAIYEHLLELNKLARKESFGYENNTPFEKGKFKEYWEEAQANQAEIERLANNAMNAIRSRVIKWDLEG